MKCNLCPRACNVDRNVNTGFCGMTNDIYAARAALHMWEEPCISGEHGSDEKDNLDILNRVGEIKGLLLDLVV